MKSTNKNLILLYNIPNNYSIQLNKILNKIRFYTEIILGIWDKNIKYISFWEKKIKYLQSIYYLNQDKLVDFSTKKKY